MIQFRMKLSLLFVATVSQIFIEKILPVVYRPLLNRFLMTRNVVKETRLIVFKFNQQNVKTVSNWGQNASRAN